MLDAALWIAGPLLVLLTLVGLGDLLIPRDTVPAVGRTVAAALAGLLLVAAVVPIINLFLPLGTRPVGVTMTVGLSGAALALRRGTLRGRAFGELLLASIIAGAVYRLSAVVVPIRLLTDTVLYHLAHMEWIAHSVMPLGTANIQTRLGFNPGFMTIASAFRWEPLGESHLFLLEVAVRTLLLLVVLHAMRCGNEVRDLALALTVVVIPFFAMNKSGTDGNIGFLLLVAALMTVLIARRSDPEERADGLVLLLATIALVTTFKLSAVTVALLAVPLLVGAGRVPLSSLRARGRLPLVLTAMTAVGGWLLKGLAATGCLAFPAASSCLPVSWGVGTEVADTVSAHTTEFARRTTLTGTSVDLLELSWVSAWLPSYLTSVPMLVVLAALPVAALARARRRGGPLAWTVVTVAALPAALTVLSVADLLGGRRFLGVDPTLVGVIEDYPNADVLVLMPAIGLALLLATAALAPREVAREPGGQDAARVIAPFLGGATVAWLLLAPAVRFAWALHVLLAALLLARWIGTVDLERLRTRRPRRAAAIGGVIGSLVTVGLGLTSPALPIAAPEVEAVATLTLPPDGRQVFVPPDIEACSTLFPCAPTPPSEARSTTRLGRPVFEVVRPDRERVLRELGIVR